MKKVVLDSNVFVNRVRSWLSTLAIGVYDAPIMKIHPMRVKTNRGIHTPIPVQAEKYGCLIHAYCLMTNHVHLLLTPLYE